jgi:error-prone DNA polymerase
LVAPVRLITVERRRAGKGEYRLLREDLIDLPLGLLALWVPERTPSDADAQWLRGVFGDRLWIAVESSPSPWPHRNPTPGRAFRRYYKKRCRLVFDPRLIERSINLLK